MDSLRRSGNRMPGGRMVLELARATRVFRRFRAQASAGPKRIGDAADRARAPRARYLGYFYFQPGVFRTAILVYAGDGFTDGSFSAARSRVGGRAGRIWRSDGRYRIRAARRISARSWIWIRSRVRPRRNVPCRGVLAALGDRAGGEDASDDAS